MIPAAEALALPSAQLTPDELTAADALEIDIEAHVRASMQRSGVVYKIKEVRSNVIAELNQRFKRAGYMPIWKQLAEQNRLNPGDLKLVGYQLELCPSDEAYREAARAALS